MTIYIVSKFYGVKNGVDYVYYDYMPCNLVGTIKTYFGFYIEFNMLPKFKWEIQWTPNRFIAFRNLLKYGVYLDENKAKLKTDKLSRHEKLKAIIKDQKDQTEI